MKTEYIYICAQVYCNDLGSGIEYYTDYERFDNRNDAIKNGWKQRESDDFNIGGYLAFLIGEECEVINEQIS